VQGPSGLPQLDAVDGVTLEALDTQAVFSPGFTGGLFVGGQ
jgi:hypothetical protein